MEWSDYEEYAHFFVFKVIQTVHLNLHRILGTKHFDFSKPHTFISQN